MQFWSKDENCENDALDETSEIKKKKKVQSKTGHFGTRIWC